MKITKIDLLYCDPVEGGWRPSLCRIYTDEGIYGDGEVALSLWRRFTGCICHVKKTWPTG